MTARSDDPGVSPGTSAAAAAAGGEIWGTWEELLLACAVQRHGTASWDSVAMEVQSRCPAAAADRLTPTGCRLRFRLLHRRFAAGAENGGGGGGDGDEDPDASAADGWVEELRKLRVAELRREVERYDLSIGSLQSKVKRLKEERERSISGEAIPAVKEDDEEEEEPATGKGSLEDDAPGGEDRVSGGESWRSCKESNSSDLKRPAHDAATASAAGDDGGAAASEEGEEEEAAADELLAVKREEASGESVAGSKEADKESSDVQSSASPSRRCEREEDGVGGGGEEAEAETEEASASPSPSPSAAAALPAAEAEALLAFLESVRSSKPGSVFERRLESQDDAKYRSTIRRHVDLETVRSKLEGGGGGGGACYGSASEFYRDLLLLCANALVFFPLGSPEHAAAGRTRALVSKQMSASLHKQDQPGISSGKATAPASKKAKAEADVGSLLEKTAPIIVCRKRSSIAKAAAAAAKEEKVDKAETDKEEENEVGKKKAGVAKDKAARGPRTNKTRAGAAARKAAAPNQKTGDNGGSDSDAPPAEATKKPDKKGGGPAVGSGAGVAKKRNAVNFLNRMKQGSAPSTERVSLLETLKLSAAAEQKKAGKGGDGKKEPAGGSGSKRGKGTGAPPGRRIGRPPKRAAAPPSPPPAKRARGGGVKRGGKK
ncbi:hypothetical protein BAE44_0016056 [Dichanthelium oligosanthes]|uniref:Bromo domain-containing protein n=1 Tax=Dichanthelium oligosanthes TaxID=888268 RepID=A0A1E5VD37_9POAL|nr:hypothetical protein BAE44_0016056 [Dichanthelium oligosanthes]